MNIISWFKTINFSGKKITSSEPLRSKELPIVNFNEITPHSIEKKIKEVKARLRPDLGNYANLAEWSADAYVLLCDIQILLITHDLEKRKHHDH